MTSKLIKEPYSSFHLVTAILTKPSRRKAGSLPWQTIGSMACIPMGEKDQGAVSDETYGNAQCSELSAKSLIHHNFFKHKKYVRNIIKLKWTL
ncbi:hypothetical protein T03_10177 [Trichinella britovi]|uniref:Uncharacterized protein n=1 Tax=Trichinella britovi TaxID=45882 RepID=A0A0V1C969_TRIBR|nr:hypothetical protein T03_10177 [Trichinella britovi]